jgi:hypothetical protein
MAKDAAPIFMIRKGTNLCPEMRADLERIEAIKPGERVRVEIRQSRSVPKLRLYWRMLSYVVEATECAANSETLHSAIKLELGYGTPVKLRNGMMVLVPGSIAFESMDEPTFDAFFQRAQEWIAKTYGIDPLAFMEIAA